MSDWTGMRSEVRAQEEAYGDIEQPTMPALPFAALITRLANRADHEGYDPLARQAQRLCGCWVALRRLALGLSREAAAGHAGLSVEALLALEVGLAEQSMGEIEAWERFYNLLADQTVDVDLVAAIVESCLGVREANNRAVMGIVEYDLGRTADDGSGACV